MLVCASKGAHEMDAWRASSGINLEHELQAIMEAIRNAHQSSNSSLSAHMTKAVTSFSVSLKQTDPCRSRNIWRNSKRKWQRTRSSWSINDRTRATRPSCRSEEMEWTDTQRMSIWNRTKRLTSNASSSMTSEYWKMCHEMSL